MGETFTILDDGETLITGEWVPSPEDLSIRMLALADYYDNMMIPLAESRQAAIAATEYRFDSQTAPDGTPWPALDPDYLDWKVNNGDPEDEILVMTGAGKAAATSEGAWFIYEDALWFDVNRLPDYMSYHQAGTDGLNAEQRGILNKLANKETITMHEAGVVIEKSDGRGKSLPKREFVGFNDFDIQVFEDIWNTWFASGIVEEFPSGGVSFFGQTGFNMMGEFPIIGRTGRGQPILRTPAGPRFGRL